MPVFENPRVEYDEWGHCSLVVEVDGKTARIYWEQKLRPYGFLFLGPEFEDLLPPVVLPPDPAVGRPEPDVFYGFTGDPELLRLYDEMMEADGTGEWPE